jgi:hypothetical protein
MGVSCSGLHSGIVNPEWNGIDNYDGNGRVLCMDPILHLAPLKGCLA